MPSSQMRSLNNSVGDKEGHPMAETKAKQTLHLLSFARKHLEAFCP